MSQTRGERNNNPGNIEHGEPWRGLADNQPDPRFCTFTDPKYGFRALAKTLITYQTRPGIPGVGLTGVDTVREIIYRWAPPERMVDGKWVKDNDTEAYVAAVAGRLACDPDTHIDTRDYTQLFPLVDAITRHENGRNIWGRDVIDQGLALAGVTP